MKRTLVTSALPYANSSLHLGHIAGAYLPADIYVRYLRLKGEDVIFICGTDEHGVPILISAEKEGISPSELVNRYHEEIKRDFECLGISFDNFSRTSIPLHHRNSQDFFMKLLKQGMIDKREMEQFYCNNCNKFLADRYIEGNCPYCKNEGARGDQCESCGKWLEPTNLIEPKCKLCGKIPVLRKTEHWFFKLSMFENKLKDWIDKKENWKDNVRKFSKGWLSEGLMDRSITRDLSWGVPVPLEDGKGKVLYVWFDAPIGYISSTMEWAERIGTPDLWKEYWLSPDVKLVHFLGKDNIVFHAIVWPAMLMAHGDYVLPSEIPANEHLIMEGKKLSKSRNWAIWLKDYLEKFEPDPLRYYLAANAPETKDSEFTYKDFQIRNNTELADTLGNFIHRTLTFVEKYFNGKVPEPYVLSVEDVEIANRIKECCKKIGEFLESFYLRRATEEFMELARIGNRYFDSQAPWKTIETDPKRCSTTIFSCVQLVKSLAVIMRPFLPFSSKKIFQMLAMQELEKTGWEEGIRQEVKAGHPLGNLTPLFRKIEDEEIEFEIAKLTGDKTKETLKSEDKIMTEQQKISFLDFKKLDLCIAEVKTAEKVPNSDNLLNLTVDSGEEKHKIVAGIAKFYSPESLIGKKIVYFRNLETAKIRDIESNGMLLAASDTDSDGKLKDVVLLIPERDIPTGSKVS